jgi:hypothetical protein
LPPEAPWRSPERQRRRVVEENDLPSKLRKCGRGQRFRCQSVLVEENDLGSKLWALGLATEFTARAWEKNSEGDVSHQPRRSPLPTRDVPSPTPASPPTGSPLDSLAYQDGGGGTPSGFSRAFATPFRSAGCSDGTSMPLCYGYTRRPAADRASQIQSAPPDGCPAPT